MTKVEDAELGKAPGRALSTFLPILYLVNLGRRQKAVRERSHLQ